MADTSKKEQTKNEKSKEAVVSMDIEPTTSQVTVKPIELTPEQKLNNLKQTGRFIINCFRDEQQDISQALKSYGMILKNYVKKENLSDIEREWIFKEFLEGSCMSLMKREHHHYGSDWNMADSISDCCKLLIQIAVPLIADDSDLAMQIIYFCMNSSNAFFRHFGHDFRQRRGVELSETEANEQKEWRSNEIAEGKYVDYLLSNRWRYGIITKIKIIETQNQKYRVLHIQPLMDGMYQTHRQRNRRHHHHRNSVDSDDNNVFTEEFTLSPKTIGQISKPLTKSMQYLPKMLKWRKELNAEEGSNKCDVLDSVHKWYTCTILEVDPGANRFKVNYDGWSSRYDEYCYRDDMKVQPFMSNAKGGRESQGVQGSLDDLEPWCEDEEDDDDVFAVYRGRLTHASFHLVDILNEFGKCGGFDAIIKRLQNRKPNIPVKNLRFIISPLSKCFKLYSKKCAKNFIDSMHKLTFEVLESLTNEELRDLRKDFLERIINSIENFLKRYKTGEEIAEIVERFQLKMALRRLKCATIERRVNGVQYIADICSRTRKHSGYGYTTRFITPDFLMKWIEDNELLQLLFGNKSHPQLMKNSVDILKFILNEAELKMEHLDVVWSAIDRAASKDDDVENELQTLCSVIDSLTFYLDVKHFEFLFDKFEGIDMKLFTKHHLELMSSLSKNTTKNSDESPQRCLKILWNIIQDESQCDAQIVEASKELIKECLSGIFSQELRMPTMQKCIKNVENHSSVCSSLQLLVKIIDLYPISTHMSNEPERWTMIGHLDKNCKLLDSFFNDVKHFKETCDKTLVKKDESKYLEQIKERLQFLQYILSNTHNIKLTEKYIKILWSSCIVNALTAQERKLTFSAFKRMVHFNRKGTDIYLDEGVAEMLFTKHMMNDININEMEFSAYECFERYFVFVNCQNNHLQMLQSNKSFMVNNYDNLIGLEMLWQIAMTSTHTFVNKKSTDLINKICNRVSAELKPKIAEIRASVIAKIMNELSSSLKSKNNDKCERALNLLHHFLNASESRGLCGLRPHEALSRGKKWKLNIINKIGFNGYGKAPSFGVTIHENDSLWDLRRAIGKKADTYPELTRIYYRGSVLKEEQNSQSLQGLNMRDGITLHVHKKDMKSERVPLLGGNPLRLVPAAKAAMTEIFHQFATNDDQTMSADDMRAYILKCGAGASSASPNRIQQIFSRHGTQRSAYQDRLSVQGFFNFYQSACEDRPDHVWSDLSVFKYRYDLRKEDEARKEEEALLNAKPDTLPRHILTSNNEYFDILFRDCMNSKSSKIRQMAWKMILRLPTNPGRMSKIMNLSDDNLDWEVLLPSNNLFSLSYGVLICESLTIEPEAAVSDNELQQRAKWRSAFLEKKGFEHLIKILGAFKYDSNDQNDEDMIEKVTQQLALTAVLKMIQSFFVGAISCNQSMGDVVDQIRSLSLSVKEEEKDKKMSLNDNVSNTKVNNKKKDKKHGNGGSNDLYEMADYAILIDSDDDSDDNSNANGDAEDFTALLEQQFADAVMKASGMPESMYNETKNEWDQLEGGGEGNNTNDGTMIGPQLPGSSSNQSGQSNGNQQQSSNNMQQSEEKDGKEEKGPPDAVEEDTKNAPLGNFGDEDMDVDLIGVDADLPDEDNDNDDEKVKEDKDADDASKVPPTAKRQNSIKFQQAIKNVTEKYADQLIESLDFPKLMKQLLNILKNASSDQSPTVQRDLVVRNAVRLWVSVLLYRPRLLLDLFDFLRKDPSFILAAIQSTDPELGSEFAKSIRKLCRYVDESPNYKSDKKLQSELPGINITKFFLEEILLKHLPSSDSVDIDPEQHFYLLISLMQEYSDKYDGSVAEFSDLFKYLTTELKSYKSRETLVEEDKILIGLMTLLSVLLTGHIPFRKECGKLGIIEELLNNFLFATGKTDEDKKLNLPKCKTHISRELAYRLVVQCILSVPENYSIVHKILTSLHTNVRIPSAWEYCPEKSVKSDRGFVGLKNLGSTCYMNSLLQQFYMIPHFRNAIISSGVDLIKEKKMSDDECKESLLFQLMRMFSFLSLSEKQAFDTINFCRSYKDETGRPIDVRIQQDAQEFFTILADRIETELKDTKYRYLLADTFGGQVVHQMICQAGCNKIRDRTQPFPIISLPIKNRTNMKESLEAFVQSETLDGVTCDHCAKKTKTLKRQVLHTLPNTIFFHLKRFELNFETFRHEKSNARWEFPLEIDLEPYTKEGLLRRDNEQKKEKESNEQKDNNENKDNDQSEEVKDEKYSVHPKEYYEYELVGVVVHTGSAEAGHYYSYIRDRVSGEWNEFNDSLIKSFDLKYLDNDCYGGKKKVKSSTNWGGDWEHDQDKIKNAYILVYDRKKYQEPIHEEDEKKKKEAEEAAAAKKANGDNATTPQPNSPKPKDESKEEQDNKEQEKEKDAAISTPNPSKNDNDEDEEEEKKEPEKELEPAINVLKLFETEPQTFVETLPKVWDDILDTNMKFTRDRQLFNLQYFQFVYNLVCAAPKSKNVQKKKDDDKNKNASNGLEVIQMATFVCFRFLARTADKRIIFNRFVTYLKFLYTDNVNACQWLLSYLSTQRSNVESYILSTRDNLVMHGFSDLVIDVLKQLKDVDGPNLMQTETVMRKVPIQPPQNQQQQQQQGQNMNIQFVDRECIVAKCPSSKFMDLLIEMIDIVPKHWFRFHCYFKVFYEYCSMGHYQRNYLIDRQMINILGDFYLGGNRSPYKDIKKGQYHIMGNRMYPPKFDRVLQIICMLLCSCHTPQTKKMLMWYNEKKDEIKGVEDKKKWLKLSPAALSYDDNEIDPDRKFLHDLSDLDAKLPHCRFLYDRMINEAHHSTDILAALNTLVVHWSFEDRTYSKEVVRMISEGVDKSGADQVQTFLSIMRQFIAIEDDEQGFRLKQLHNPSNPEKSILHFIRCYRLQHQPFSYQSIRALVLMMIDNETYCKYMLSKRAAWKWWDQWLDSFCHRPTYIHNRDNERMTRDKIAFYEEQYMPLLKKNGIECQRAHNSGMNHGNINFGNNNHHGAVYGNMNFHQRDNYFPSGQEPGQFDDDDNDGAANAGVVQRQNSRQNDDLYDDDDDDINEGGAAGGAGAGDVEIDQQQMEIQDNDDDDDDDDVVANNEQMLADV